jgi:hypothetical protein
MSPRDQISVGAAVLLISWIVQNIFFVWWDSTLADAEQARNILSTYDANNSLFNALYVISSPEDQSVIRTYQVENYKKGLQELAPFISAERESSIQRVIDENPGDLDALQLEIDNALSDFLKEQEEVAKGRFVSLTVFSILYIIGTSLIVLGERGKKSSETDLDLKA